MSLLYNTPSLLLFIVFSILCFSISFLVIKHVNRIIPRKFRCEENQAIICISTILGMIYAILVGFIVLYELNNYNKLDDAESAEAKAMFAVFRMAKVLPEPSSTKIRSLVVEYASNVINNEWPAMASGKAVDNKGIEIINEISKELRSFNNTIRSDNSIILQALNQISVSTNLLFDDHEQRIKKTHSSMSSNIWLVILIATFLTIGINCVLGMEWRLHIFCMAALSLMVSAILYLIVTLDQPYRGDFSIKPSTFISTLEYLNLKVK